MNREWRSGDKVIFHTLPGYGYPDGKVPATVAYWGASGWRIVIDVVVNGDPRRLVVSPHNLTKRESS